MDKVQQKITKIGNSYGVTIPLVMLEHLELEQGDDVQMEVVEGKIILSKDRKVSLPEGISSDFFEKFQETFASYDATLKGLINQ